MESAERTSPWSRVQRAPVGARKVMILWPWSLLSGSLALQTNIGSCSTTHLLQDMIGVRSSMFGLSDLLLLMLLLMLMLRWADGVCGPRCLHPPSPASYENTPGLQPGDAPALPGRSPLVV